METTTKTQARTGGAKMIALCQITDPPKMSLRSGLDAQHVKVLALAIRSGAKLPPITLWQEQDKDGMITGRLLLLDGRHRLAALRQVKPDQKQYPALIIDGDHVTAMLLAVALNTKDALPLSLSERANAAWLIVREAGYSRSKSEIARACGVAPRTVATMRTVWGDWPCGKEPDGNWWRDRKQGEAIEGTWQPMTDQERREETERLTQELQRVAGGTPMRDSELFADALEKAFGRHLWPALEHLGFVLGSPFTGLESGEEAGESPPMF